LILRGIEGWALDKRYTPRGRGLGKGAALLIRFDARNDSQQS
jgi:hypothetical protein